MLSFGAAVRQLQGVKSQAPVLAEVFICHQKRHASSANHLEKYGQGGRNSFNGVVATVFGASGYLGRYVVNRLARSGTQIIIPYRGVEDDVRHIKLMGDLGQITFLHYDLRDYDSLVKTMTHSNTVINMISRNFPTRNFSLEDCVVNGAQSIAQAAKESNVRQLIHVSALSAKGSSPSSFLQAKSRGERAVVDQFPNATIMKPAAFYGHEDRYFNKYAYLRKLPFGVPLVKGGWETTKRPVYVADVAQAIVAATKDPSTLGRTYELYGPEEYYLHDIVSFIFRMIRKPFTPITVPMAAYSLAGWFGEQSLFNPKLTRDQVIRQFLSEQVNEDAFTFDDLGIAPENMNNAALSILRRHRDYYHYDQNIDESEYIKPVTAYQ